MMPSLRLVWSPRGYHNPLVLTSAAIPPYHISCRSSYSFAIDASGAVFVIRRQLAVQSDVTFHIGNDAKPRNDLVRVII